MSNRSQPQIKGRAKSELDHLALVQHSFTVRNALSRVPLCLALLCSTPAVAADSSLSASGSATTAGAPVGVAGKSVAAAKSSQATMEAMPPNHLATEQPPVSSAGTSDVQGKAAQPSPGASGSAAQIREVNAPIGKPAGVTQGQSATEQKGAAGTPKPAAESPQQPPAQAVAAAQQSGGRANAPAVASSAAKTSAQAANAQPSGGAPASATQNALKNGVAAKQDELTRLNSTLRGLNEAWELAELERNEALALESRMKQTVLLETDSFLRGESDVSGLEQIRSEYSDQREKRQELDEKSLKLKGDAKVLEQKRATLSLNISERKTTLTKVKNSQDKAAIVELRKRLPAEISFTEKFSFSCPTSKGLSACLAEKNISALVHETIFERYGEKLRREQIVPSSSKPLAINESELKYTFTHSFVNAGVDLQGRVSAEVLIKANVRPEPSLACTALGIDQQLCAEQLYMLTIRSNKYGDQVQVDGENQGSTPVVLSLPKGKYTIQIEAGSAAVKKLVQLDKDRTIKINL